MSAPPLPRREFLLQAVAACGAPLFARFAHAQAAATPQPPIDRGAQVAAGYLGAGAGDAARTIGEAYLRQLGIENTPAAIAAATSDTLRLIAGAAGESAAVAALVQAVRRDFREVRTVELEGWVLSRTEVDLCLLVLLAN